MDFLDKCDHSSESESSDTDSAGYSSDDDFIDDTDREVADIFYANPYLEHPVNLVIPDPVSSSTDVPVTGSVKRGRSLSFLRTRKRLRLDSPNPPSPLYISSESDIESKNSTINISSDSECNEEILPDIRFVKCEDDNDELIPCTQPLQDDEELPPSQEIGEEDVDLYVSDTEIVHINSTDCDSPPPDRHVKFNENVEMRYYETLRTQKSALNSNYDKFKKRGKEEWFYQKLERYNSVLAEMDLIPELERKPDYAEKYEAVTRLRSKLINMELKVNETKCEMDYDSDCSSVSTDSVDVESVKKERGVLRNSLIEKNYLIKNCENMFVRRSLSDCRLKEIPIDEDSPEYEMFGKYCNYCDEFFHVKDFSEHVMGEFHRVKERMYHDIHSTCFVRSFVKPHSIDDKEKCEDCKVYGKAILRVDECTEDWWTENKMNDYKYKNYYIQQAQDKTPTNAIRSNFFCDLCEKDCYSQPYLERHIEGKLHKLKVKQLNKHKDSPTPSTSKAPSSTPTPTPSPKTAIKEGKGHRYRSPKRTSNKNRKMSPSPKNNDTDHYCSVCEVTVKRKTDFNRHLKSNRHAKRLRLQVSANDEDIDTVGDEGSPVKSKEELNKGSIPGTSKGSQKSKKSTFFLTCNIPKYDIAKKVKSFYCQYCNISLRTRRIYRQHRKDKSHIYRMKNGFGPLTRRGKLRQDRGLFVKGIAIGQEFTLSGEDIHSHAVFVSHEKLTYEQFRKKFLKLFKVHLRRKGQRYDLQTVRNMRSAVRYVTKDDEKAYVAGIDQDYCSTRYRMRSYSNERKRLSFGDETTSKIASSERVVARDFFNSERRLLEAELDGAGNIELREWQKEFIEILLSEEGNDRPIYWIYDVVGNEGKSFLCQHLASKYGACLMTAIQEQAIAYAYNSERMVLFDIPRDSDLEEVSLKPIEMLKNGVITSTKYECVTKRFKTPIVCMLCNVLPRRSRFSVDRWRVYELYGGKLTRLECYNSMDRCTESHYCSNNV